MTTSLALPRDAGMSALAQKHDEIAALIPAQNPVVFMDYPVAKNVGDILIMMGTLRFFEKKGLRVRLSRHLKNTQPKGKLPIARGDTIVLQGGGNFGDLYPHIQAYRERIVAEYPDNKIVIFPQTIYFSHPENFRRSAELLNKHPDLTLFVRDKVSYALAQPYFSERVRLVPDMAHQLWPTLIETIPSRPLKAAQPSPLFFMRADEEAGVSFPAFAPYRDRFVDWDTVVPTSLRLRKRAHEGIARAELWLGQSLHLDKAYFRGAQSDVHRVMRELVERDVWITSRLHVLISGLLLGKPVFAIDNSYGKLSSYIDTWREWFSPVKLIKDNNDAAAAVRTFSSTFSDKAELWKAYTDVCRAPLS